MTATPDLRAPDRVLAGRIVTTGAGRGGEERVDPGPVTSVTGLGGARLTGRAPACTTRELAGLMRAHGLGEAALAATAAWLSGERRQSPRTQAGYVRDVAWWLTWAAARGTDPLDAAPGEADLYAAALRAAGLAVRPGRAGCRRSPPGPPTWCAPGPPRATRSATACSARRRRGPQRPAV